MSHRRHPASRRQIAQRSQKRKGEPGPLLRSRVLRLPSLSLGLLICHSYARHHLNRIRLSLHPARVRDGLLRPFALHIREMFKIGHGGAAWMCPKGTGSGQRHRRIFRYSVPRMETRSSSVSEAWHNQCSQKYVLPHRESGRCLSIRADSTKTAAAAAETVPPQSGAHRRRRSPRFCQRSTTRSGPSTMKMLGVALAVLPVCQSSLPSPSTEANRGGHTFQQQRQQTALLSATFRGVRPVRDPPASPPAGPPAGRVVVGCHQRLGLAADTRRHSTARFHRGRQSCQGAPARGLCRSIIPTTRRTRSSTRELQACSTRVPVPR